MPNITKIKQNNFAECELKNIDGVFLLYLNGEPLLSSSGTPIGLPNQNFMLRVLEEWQNASSIIDLRLMPHTRICGAMVDFNSKARQSQQLTIMEYVSGDMLLMHDPENATLFEQQQKLYNNIIKQVELALGIKYNISHQLIPTTQDKQTIIKIDEWLSSSSTQIFLATYILTQTLSSFALSFALLKQIISSEIAIKAAWLEHDIQMQKWGEDEELISKRNQDIATINAIMSFI